MTRKSAARMKVAKQNNEALRPIEDVFEEAKSMFAMTVDTQIKTAKRVDNLMNIRDFCKKFWNNQAGNDIEYWKTMQDLSVNTYRKIREVVDSFELVDFRAIEVKDYFADLIPSVETITTEQQLCEAALIFMSVQPYGNKLVQMHQLIQEECAKRDIFDDQERKDDDNE